MLSWLLFQVKSYLDNLKQLVIILLIIMVSIYTVYYLAYSTINISILPSSVNTVLNGNYGTCCKSKTSESCANVCKDDAKKLLELNINGYQLSNDIFPLDKNNKASIPSSSKRRGFIVVTKYAEQQMGAAMNLLTLCKWAKYVGALPVEPFVSESIFRIPPTIAQSTLSSVLRFSDYFNITHWNKISSKYGAEHLVSWAKFLKLKPNKMIFAILLCNKHVNESTSLFINDEILENVECRNAYLQFITNREVELSHILTLQRVRSVCMTFYNSVIHINEFSKRIYGEYKASEVVVWIHKWNGILQNSRIRIYEEKFHRTPDTFKMILTSNRILKDSIKYVEQNLKSHFGSYIGISFRSARRAKFLDKDEHVTFFQKCIMQLERTIRLAITKASEDKIFLALDLGRFGDSVADLYMSNELMTTVEQLLFQAVYNGTMTMTEWEQSFVSVTNGITDSGYIAAMQSEILKNSKCLIMFGGISNFQGNILYAYKQKHQDGSACIYEVCYKPHHGT